MARLLAFTYAGLTIGAGQASSSYHLTGRYTFTHTFERAELSFEVVVSNAVAADFVAAEAALLTAYRTPDSTLTVVLSATTRHTFDPTVGVSGNTGFNARASARRVLGDENTANSSKWQCSVSVELPASLGSRAGRRASTVDVSVSPSGRRAVTVSGVYTALANAAARAQFEAQVDTYCNAVLADLTGTWEKVATPSAESDDQNKTLRFRRAYREVVYRQALGALDNAAIVDPRMVIRRARRTASSAPNFGSVEALRELSVEWSASVAIASTTDLDGLYESTVRPLLIAEAERVSGGTVVVTQETPSFDPHENTLTVSMTLLADPGAQFVSARLEIADAIDHGTILKPVWDGNPFSRDRYQGSASQVRTLTRRTSRVGTGVLLQNRVISDHGAAPKFRGFVEVRENRRARAWNEGVPGSTIPLRVSETTYVYVRAEEAAIGGGGGGSEGGTRTREQQSEGLESQTRSEAQASEETDSL